MEADGRPRTLGAIVRSWALGGALLGMIVGYVLLVWRGERGWGIAIIAVCALWGLLLGDFEDGWDRGRRALTAALVIGSAAAGEAGRDVVATVLAGLAAVTVFVPEEKVRDRLARRRMPPPEWPVTSSDR